MFQQVAWGYLLDIIYILILIAVCLRIIYDTRSISKTMAYLLFAIFVPGIGIAFYFSFGINYRKRRIYSKKLKIDESLRLEFKRKLEESNKRLFASGNKAIIQNIELIRLLSNRKLGNNPILPNNEVQLLFNGEHLFPKMIEELESAKNHIHIEFYIFENDVIGNTIKNILIRKAGEGVEVRFIYDDFGSSSIRKTLATELTKNGVKAYPFNQITLVKLANRINYRNHRKIVVIDGFTSFIGGINVCDKYINHEGNKLYWRDTHLMIRGYSSLALQQVFMADWNFCSGKDISVEKKYFPDITLNEANTPHLQVISSGPDSALPNILYSVIQAINLAEKEILLTTPYYIPDQSLQESLIIAALSGISVKLLVPKVGDSKFVHFATQAYFEELLYAGVKIYMYQKGFIHSKTFTTDRKIASVGTANLDLRSFDLNFEVSAIIYDEKIAGQLSDAFYKDLEDAEEITLAAWSKRSNFKKMRERIIRLLSPFM